jgi:putative DNA primase/helicase
LPFEYNPDADCPKWTQHLDRVLPSKAKQDYLAEYFSLPFVKHLNIEKALFLYGSGANGKSVCLEVYTALVGQENTTAETLEKLTKSIRKP